MRNRVRHALGVGASLLICAPGHAQLRSEQPPTLTPQAPLAAPAPQVMGPFRAAYRAAGEPRVLLFWNVAFDDETEAPQQSVDVVRTEHDHYRSAYEPYATGDGGRGAGDRFVHTHTTRALGSAKPGSVPLGPRELAELETAFRNELGVAAIRLVDRDKAVRFTQAERDRTGVDPRLIETDAVRGEADILLEVLLVRDDASPLGTGFKVEMTDVKAGSELASLYTDALPTLPVPSGRYVATDQGFVWQQPPPPAPAPAQVGTALADKIMQSLEQALRKTPATKRN